MAARGRAAGKFAICFQCDLGLGLLGKRHAAQPDTVQSTSEWSLHAQAMQAARSGFTSVRLLVSSHEMGSLCRMLSAVCFSVLISCAILGAVREKHGAALAPPRAGPSRPFLVCCVSRKRRAGREAKVLCSMSRQLSGGALKFMLWGGILSL